MRCRIIFFFSLRVINYHINLCSTAAAHFYFRGAAVPHSDHTGHPPTIPFSNNLLEHYLSFLMYLGGGEREGRYGRDGEHELEKRLPGIVITPLLEGASQKTRSQHSHANTRQAHSTSMPGSL